MGAWYVDYTVKGGNEKYVRSQFEKLQRRAAAEHGNSYSGDINMASGIKFTDKWFSSYIEANEYLQNTCQKWEEALVVKYKSEKTGSYYWLIGAMCSS